MSERMELVSCNSCGNVIDFAKIKDKPFTVFEHTGSTVFICPACHNFNPIPQNVKEPTNDNK